MTVLSQLAKSLTKAQREALLYEGIWWGKSKMLCGHGAALDALARKGLCFGGFRRITPLGLALRAHLKGQSDEQ